MAERIFPDVVLHHLVRNQESRHGTKVNVGVLHATEGGTLRSVTDWFDNTDSQASAHIIVGPDHGGCSAVCVPLEREAWGVAGGWNPHCVHIEQLGFSHYSTADWHKHRGTLEETARWLGYIGVVLGLPLHRARTTSFPRPMTWRTGWTEHRWMRDHDDPGPGYPFDEVVGRAHHYRQAIESYRHLHKLPVLA